MGNRNLHDNYDCRTVSIGLHTGNNSTVRGAVQDNVGSDAQWFSSHVGAWNPADTVAGGLVELGLQHSDDGTVWLDVPNAEMSVTVQSASTVSGAQSSGVFAVIPKDAPAKVYNTAYLGNKKFVALKRTTQTNVSNGLQITTVLIRGGLANAPVGYTYGS